MTCETSLKNVRSSFRPTEDFVLETPRKYYPAIIPVEHWQLRQVVSSPNANTIVYTAEGTIYCLDTSTLKCDRIASLSYAARCLATGHDWVCVGGEDGQFTAVQLQANQTLTQESSLRQAQVDALLPVELDPEARRRATQYLSAVEGRLPSTRQRRSTFPVNEQLGSSITNSITIHKPNKSRASAKDWERDDTVAVLTNNDRTVRIYSLTQSRTITTLEFQSAMNHATLSPDGELLLAVGDVVPEDRSIPVVYFYRKAWRNEKMPDGSYTLASYEWEMCSSIGVDPGLDSSFCTAFNPSGNLCAVASQDGMIAIYDTRLLDDPDRKPLRELFTSSRPGLEVGAIRCMQFSPEPWDFLVWTEHSGRACIVDVRDHFITRQTLELRTDPTSVEWLDLTEEASIPAEDLIDPLLRDYNHSDIVRRYRYYIRGENAAAAASLANIEATSERRRQRIPRAESPSGFTERERQILDALRRDRDGRAREVAGVNSIPREGVSSQDPVSINYLPPPATDSRAPLMSAEDYMAFSASWSPRESPTSTLREYMRDRQNERDRSRRQMFLDPRRRASLILSQMDEASQITRDTPSSGRVSSQTDVDPWRTIEAAMGAGTNTDSAARIRRIREADIEERFRRRQDLQRRQELHARRSGQETRREAYGRAFSSSGSRDDALPTAGCAMSADGRKLYIGTTEGIIEYSVNVNSRKFFPGITPA